MKRKIVALFMIMVMVLTVTTVAVTAKPANAASTKVGQPDESNGPVPAFCWVVPGGDMTKAVMYIFEEGTDGALWYQTSSNAGDSAWQSLGGVLTSAPVATVQPGTNVVDVFVSGTGGPVYYQEYSGSSWSGWRALGGLVGVNTGPTACSWGAGRLDVFVTGRSSNPSGAGPIFHKWWNGATWSGWENLGGLALGSSPSATSQSGGVLDVFVGGTTGALYHKAWTGARWTGWENLGGKLDGGTGPAACSWGAGRLDVFVTGAGGVYNSIFHKWWNGATWSGWENLRGLTEYSPEAHSFPLSYSGNIGSVAVYARGTDGGVWLNQYSSGYGWDGWWEMLVS